jgi:hypothetical protein
VLLGAGNGTFAAATSYPAGSGPISMTTADFNGDNHRDLAVAHGNAIAVLLGAGDGSFAGPVDRPGGEAPLAIVTGDLNADGKPDLAATNPAVNTVSILLNTGNSFTSAVGYPAGTTPALLTLGDFNNDAITDVAVASYNIGQGISFLFGNGDGTFGPPQSHPPYAYQSVAAADFNGDGRLDLAGGASAGLNIALNSIPRLTIATASSIPSGSIGNVASVPDHPGSTYAWSITGGGTITSGQGTSSITYDAGPGGTRMTLSVSETAASSCAAGTKRVLVDFLDVPATHPFHSFITKLALNGVTGGCGGGNYCPNNPVLRSQMAIFLLRGEHGESYVPPAEQGIFADVPPGSFAANFIEQLYNEGITGGCATNPLRYCPGNSVLRSQMAIFLLRAEHGSAYAPPAATGIFQDVPPGSFGANFIERLYGEGVTGGCSASPLRYCPNDTTTRGAMAVFLTRTFRLQELP